MGEQVLKPCPFCGGAVDMDKAYPYWDDEKGTVYNTMLRHFCNNGFDVSLYITRGYKTPEEAEKALAKLWNHRT